MRSAVRLAIADLNARQRTAISLLQYERQSYGEIAQAMGISTSAVKSLLHRARVNLRDRLLPYVDDGQLRTNPRFYLGQQNFLTLYYTIERMQDVQATG